MRSIANKVFDITQNKSNNRQMVTVWVNSWKFLKFVFLIVLMPIADCI